MISYLHISLFAIEKNIRLQSVFEKKGWFIASLADILSTWSIVRNLSNKSKASILITFLLVLQMKLDHEVLVNL